jgi:hypothetical protein
VAERSEARRRAGAGVRNAAIAQAGRPFISEMRLRLSIMSMTGVKSIPVRGSANRVFDGMGLVSWLRLIVTLVGAGGAVYGVWILSTARAQRGDQRAFRRLRDAVLYYLSFGLALTLLTLSQLWIEHHQTLLTAAALIATMVLIGLIVHYRPRKNNRP